MTEESLIIITGGAGFIGSNLLRALNERGFIKIMIVDSLNKGEKWKNLLGCAFQSFMEPTQFLESIQQKSLKYKPAVIFHLGARTNTQEKNAGLLIKNNTIYSKILFDYSAVEGIRFIYASSAATYGNGKRGYSDSEYNLEPLNCYGYSKHLFDLLAKDSKNKPLQWVGLKFFNVYGPHEEHKGEMASSAYRGYREAVRGGIIRLFKSYKEGYEHGCQKRDFVYVKDAVKAILFFLDNTQKSGIFNVGTGKARSFLDLANAVFMAIGKEPKIEFIDMPEAMREKYQYFTEADISSLRAAGYADPFHELEDGVKDYVQNYLSKERTSG